MQRAGHALCRSEQGEPFIRRDIFEIFETHDDIGFPVYTHCGLLDDACVSRLAELGNVMPCISLEGFEAETDARRGKGHFQKVMETMDRLRAVDVLFGFSATSLRDNVETICSETFIYRPCMIIDNPRVLRDAVNETGAFPTHPGAEAVITDFASALDTYAEEWGLHADAAWEKIKDRILARNPASHLHDTA